MAKKKYKIIYAIMNRWRISDMSVHIVEEKPNSYKDITSVFVARMRREIEHRGENPTGVFVGGTTYLGDRLLKRDEYTPVFGSGAVYMFGSDLTKLQLAWNEAFTPHKDSNFSCNTKSLLDFAEQLNTERIEYNGN